MVETTSDRNLVNQDNVTVQDKARMNSAAEIWWSNMLAVIKLRQKGTTMVSKLPSGVFRHVLEYKIPNEFKYRYSNLPRPIKSDKHMRDRHFPAVEKLSYHNYLKLISDNSYNEFRFTLLDGANCGSKFES